MVLTQTLRRPSALALATLLLVASLAPAFIQQKANAYGLLDERSIQMSSSAASAASTSYLVTFKAGTTATIKSIAVDFCANSPILDDSCTATVGTTTPSLGAPTVTTAGGAGIGNLTGSWTAAATNSSRTLTLTNATGMALTAGTSYYFTLTTATNPSTVGSFYARILTFPNDVTSNYADGYTATNVDTNIPTDAGGVALSTANQITITAKVQERLVFCVYSSDAAGYATNDCTGKSSAGSILLGDTNGVLSPTGPYVDKNARFSVTTNATYDAIVRFKGSTLYRNSDAACGTAANCITESTSTPNTSTAGSEEFGLCVYQQAGSGLTRDAVYDGGAGAECAGTTQTAGTGSTGGDNSAEFGLDTNNTTGTRSTYGDTLATKPAGDYSTGNLVFLGNISNTTEAGIYATTLTFIATGTY